MEKQEQEIKNMSSFQIGEIILLARTISSVSIKDLLFILNFIWKSRNIIILGSLIFIILLSYITGSGVNELSDDLFESLRKLFNADSNVEKISQAQNIVQQPQPQPQYIVQQPQPQPQYIVQQPHVETSWADIGKGILYIGLTVIAVYASVQLFNHVFDLTNKDIAQEIIRTNQQTLNLIDNFKKIVDSYNSTVISELGSLNKSIITELTKLDSSTNKNFINLVEGLNDSKIFQSQEFNKTRLVLIQILKSIANTAPTPSLEVVTENLSFSAVNAVKRQ